MGCEGGHRPSKVLDLAPTWRQGGNFFSDTVGGGTISFLLHVCIPKMLRTLPGIPKCMQNMKFFMNPDLPHPAPQTWLLGQDLGGKIFSQKPKRCVFKMISATRASF